jgi:hypothetical protein
MLNQKNQLMILLVYMIIFMILKTQEKVVIMSDLDGEYTDNGTPLV